jgi:hypothetical protein
VRTKLEKMIFHVQEELNYQKVKDTVHLEKKSYVYHVQEELSEDHQRIKDKVTRV